MIQTKAIHKITRRFLLLFFILRFLNIIYYHDRPIKTPNFTFLGIKLGVCFIIC